MGDRGNNMVVLLTSDPRLANMQDLEGNTALHVACRRGKKDLVKTLLVCDSHVIVM